MARFTMPIEQVGNNDFSGVGAGWLLNFYTTETTDRKDTFSDSGLSSANSNPVIADSAGRFGDIFMESGTYKVVLTDEDSVEIWTADPVDGSLGATGAVDVKDEAYTITIGDATKLIAVDASGGAITITLLAATTAGNGFEVTVKKTDSSANAVTVDGNGSETVDGAATNVLADQYASATYRCDGSNWHVVGDILAAITTRGDIVVGNSSGAKSRLALGAADEVLSSDGTDAAWALPRLPRGFLAGLVLSNDSTPDEEVKIVPGECRDAAHSVNMVLASILTKQINNTFALGDDAGGMNDGDAVGASEWFHVHLLSNADGTVVDAGFDTSITAAGLLADAAVIAAGLTKYRRIGSVLTDATSDILKFLQVGDEVLWTVSVPELTTGAIEADSPGTTIEIATPVGVRTRAHLAVNAGTNTKALVFAPGDRTPEAPSLTGVPAPHVGTSADASGQVFVLTDTSSQIRVRVDVDSTDSSISCMGYIDRRGRDD